MDRFHRGWLARMILGLAAGLALCLPATAADRQQNGRNAPTTPRGEIELFAGIEQQQLDVRLIPCNASQCRLLISNKTDRPLSVKMPASFAGVPVLGQIGRNPGAAWPPGGNPSVPAAGPKDPQRVGGGSSPAVFNVPPESMRQVKVETVCLDHGNPAPRPAIKYEIRPMAAATNKAGLAEVCELLGRHEIGHRAAQLAAWHLSNDMSWQALAALRTRQAIGTTASYTKEEIVAAKKAVEKATQLHLQRQPSEAVAPTLASSLAH